MAIITITNGIWVMNNHKKGGWINEFILTFPFVITYARIDFHFKQGSGSNVAFKWSTEDATIEVIDAYKIKLNGRNLDAKAGDYVGDLQVIFADGKSITYFEARLKIVQDITQII